MKGIWALLIWIAITLTAGVMALSEQAEDITASASFTVPWRSNEIVCMLDGDYQTEWRSGERGADWIEISLPQDKRCESLYILYGGRPDQLIIEERISGQWSEVRVDHERFNTQYISLHGAAGLRLRMRQGELRIMEIRLYGSGDPPRETVQFTHSAEKADMMILACHPDDELLWMGGLIPLYAGELGMQLQLLYMTSLNDFRRCEAMDGLWHLGVRNGPVFLGYPDQTGFTFTEAEEFWDGRTEVALRIARMIRRYRPEVLVTQDVKGEYGHMQHRVMVTACTLAVKLAADPGCRALKDLPAWGVKKYYIHLYPECALTIDMEKPLSAFGGKSAYQMAEEAFRYHKSQQNPTGYGMDLNGPYDMRKYGLRFSTVGPDEAHDGLFEHIDGLYEIEKQYINDEEGAAI